MYWEGKCFQMDGICVVCVLYPAKKAAAGQMGRRLCIYIYLARSR